MKLKSKSDSFNDLSIISSEVEIIGNLITKGNIRIDGKVKGDISADGSITFGNASEVQGKIKGENITIGGKIIGSIFSSEKLTLESGSELQGDLYAKILIIEEGAKFFGKSNMSIAEKTEN